MNTHTVTSMVLLTWSTTLPRSAEPQKSSEKVSILKAKTTTSTNMASGTSLAMVVMVLIMVAPCTPRSTRKCRAHSSTEAHMMAGRVLPSPKKPSASNEPSAENSTTK